MAQKCSCERRMRWSVGYERQARYLRYAIGKGEFHKDEARGEMSERRPAVSRQLNSILHSACRETESGPSTGVGTPCGLTCTKLYSEPVSPLDSWILGNNVTRAEMVQSSCAKESRHLAKIQTRCTRRVKQTDFGS